MGYKKRKSKFRQDKYFREHKFPRIREHRYSLQKLSVFKSWIAHTQP